MKAIADVGVPPLMGSVHGAGSRIPLGKIVNFGLGNCVSVHNWPNLRASMPIDAVRGGPDHYLMALVIDEDQHRPLTRHTRKLLHRLHDRYQARATAH